MELIEIQELLSPEEFVLLAKFLYNNIGDTYSQDQIIDDNTYEYVKSTVDTDHPSYKIPWDEVTYSDVKDILNRLDYPKPKYNYSEQQEIPKHLEHLLTIWKKSKSIEMVETNRDVMHYFSESENLHRKMGVDQKHLLMLKMDGWNLQMYYMPGHLQPVLITTRGRGGNLVICTDILSHLSPPLEATQPTRVSGELVLDNKILTHLRVKYNRPFKNSRNSISSIIHGTIDVDAIKEHVGIFAFDINLENEFRFNSRSQTLGFLSSLGFKTPPTLIISDYPLEYKDNFNSLQRYYVEEMSKNWECDGIVVCPDSYEVTDQMSNSNPTFQDGFVAVKMGTWSKKLYTGQVEDIICPPSSGGAFRELTAIIKPTDTDDGRTVRRVPLKNLNRAKCGNDAVDIGDEILFSYHSKQVIKFRGKNGKIYYN